MKNEEVIKRAKELLEEGNIFEVLEIRGANHKPHQFMVGPKHVAHAYDHYSGLLGEETLKEVNCAYPGCRLSYDEHTYDKVMFLQLKRNMTNQEASDEVKKIIPLLEGNGIVGVSFVETKEKFRISEEKEE